MPSVITHLTSFSVCSAVENYARLEKLLTLTSYFAVRKWTFEHDNVDRLWNKLSPVDKKLYKFNTELLDREAYATSSVKGGRIYLLKDPIETLPQGKKRLFKLMLLHYFLMAVLVCLMFVLLRFVYRCFFY